MTSQIRIGNLFGIPFYVNPSWFFILGLMTLTYGGELASFFHLGGLTPWALGFVASLLLFASVIAHELGHSFVAISQGIEVKSITLFLFGGIANLEKESETPLQSFLVAIAGPVVSLLLFAIFTLIGFKLTLWAPVEAIVGLLASINLMLALFNLIPGLPLDGGGILKAAVWQISGNPNKGIIFASRVGQFFGWLAIIAGSLGILNILPIGNFWTLLIGWFLLQNAGASARYANISEKLSSFVAEDAVVPDSPIVNGDLNLREFANNYVIGQQKWRKFMVTDEDGKLLGNIAIDDLKKVPTSLWPSTPVNSLITPADNIKTVASNLSLFEVVQIIEKQNLQELTVVRDNGIVVGLLEKASIINLMQSKAQAA